MSLSIKDGNGTAQNIAVTNAGGQLTSWSQPSDGTNPISKTFDLDTSGSTHEWNICVGLRISASGGSIEAKGQKAMANSLPVAIASDQSAVPVSGTFWQATQPVSGSVNIGNTPAVTEANLDATIVAWAGTTAPTKGLGILGKTNDGTPQYQPIPEGAGGRSVIIEGYSGGQAVAVSGTITANQGGAPWSDNVTQWNGTTVDTNSGNKSAGTLRVVLATDQPQLTNALKVDGSAVTQPVSGTVTGNQGSAAGLGSAWPIKLTDGTNTMPTMDAAGRAGFLKVTDGTNTMPTGDVAARALYTTLVPVTSGGLTTYRVLWPGNSTGVNIKGSAGQVYEYYFANTSTSWRYLKLYDKATAPTTGTDTPLRTYPLPPSSAAHLAIPDGLTFANGIGIAVTTGVADGDTGAPTANDVIVNLGYK